MSAPRAVPAAEKICEVCGVTYNRRKEESIGRWNRRRFCSNICVGKAIKGRDYKPRSDPIERFMSFVMPEPNSGCWLWMGALSQKGYARFGIGPSKTRDAHIFSYKEFCGTIHPGQEVCHRCDIRSCVNPDHLFAATHLQNIADAVAKGRMARGERIGSARLTTADVIAIRASSETAREAGARYGVGRYTIHCIRERRTWKHV
jgi:hypothetical protein